MQLFRSLAFVHVALAASFIVGCGHSGPSLGTVTGVVKTNNAPLPGAQLIFVPEKGSPSYGITDNNGRFRLIFSQQRSGALLGNHAVLIRHNDRRRDKDDNPIETPANFKVAEKYQQPGVLAATVKAGRNSFVFELDPAEATSVIGVANNQR